MSYFQGPLSNLDTHEITTAESSPTKKIGKNQSLGLQKDLQKS